MEKTKTQTKGGKTSHSEKIKQAYIAYVLEHGMPPPSIFKFVKDLKIKEEAFYENFNSFEAVEKDIWLGIFETTVSRIEEETVYTEYSVREKMLAFYYTLIEVMKSNRSYLLQTTKRPRIPEITPYYLETFRKGFKAFINDLLVKAQETGEVQKRQYISNKYDEGIWLQFLFVLNFWFKDNSKGFEKTDAAIEKAVNLSFELMGRGPLDEMVGFAKFLWQNR